jgi:hypothetical protein
VTPAIKASRVHASDQPDSNSYRFSVDPNYTPRIREVVLSFGGDQLFTIAQGGAKLVNIAAAPGTLESNLKRKQTQTLVLTVWSEDEAASYDAVLSGSPEWVRISPAATEPSKASPNSQRFQLVVNSGKLAFGRHEAMLHVSIRGSPASAIQIPVVLTVRPK